MVYFWLCGILIAECGLFSSCGEQGLLSGYGTGFSLQWLLLLQSMGSRVLRLQQLQHMGSAALQYVGSSQARG